MALARGASPPYVRLLACQVSEPLDRGHQSFGLCLCGFKIGKVWLAKLEKGREDMEAQLAQVYHNPLVPREVAEIAIGKCVCLFVLQPRQPLTPRHQSPAAHLVRELNQHHSKDIWL